MSKRKNDENAFDALPSFKRVRNTQPLQASAILNAAQDLECPIVFSSFDKPHTPGLSPVKPDLKAKTPAPRSAISTVPAEILDKVFDLILQNDYGFAYGGWNISKISPFSPRRKALCSLAGVSKLWNGIAGKVLTAVKVITTHGIWDEESADDTLDKVPDMVAKHVEEKGLTEEPILLQVGPLGRSPIEGETDPLPESFFPTILAFTNIRSLILTSVDAVALARVPASGLFPNMTSLVLKVHDTDIWQLASEGLKITLFKDAACLTHVTIVNALLQETQDVAATRTNLLELPSESVTHVLENHRNFDSETLPSAFYNIEEFTNLAFLWIRMPKDIDQARLENLGPYVMPNLTSLIIDATPASEVDNVPGMDLLQRITAPGLKHLGLIGHTLDFDDAKWAQKDAEGALFLEKLASLAELESLSLSYPRIPQVSFNKILAAVKGVKYLDLHITASREDYKVVFDAIALREGETEAVLPRLERLSFDVTNQRETWPARMGVPTFSGDLSDPDVLAAFIKSRRGSELPDSVVQIEEVMMFTDWDEERTKKWSIDLEDDHDVLAYRHLTTSDYTHLRHGFQRDRALERTKSLDNAYEAKQFYACGPLYREF